MKKRFLGILVFVIILSGLNMTSVLAATKSTTPLSPWHYLQLNANCQLMSQSSAEKAVWKAAMKSWKANGFTWNIKDKSKTKLSMYSDSSSKGLNIAGLTRVNFTADGYIISSSVQLNKATLNKYNYTKQERIHVAEHELGHALGLSHNKVGSISVMNPANRYYTIQKCDVRGLEKRYSSFSSNASLNPNKTQTMTIYDRLQPEIRRVSSKYDEHTKTLVIMGQTTVVDQIAITYTGQNQVVVKTNEDGTFYTCYKVSGYGKALICGLDENERENSNVIEITSNEYMTPTAVVDTMEVA